MSNNHHFDIIIVGAGASGLMAAVQASDRNLNVLVLEHQPKAGVKILSTGNGRCNLTNSDMSAKYFRCDDPLFFRPALKAFSEQDTLRFFEERLHLFCKEKNGYWYPRSNQATAVREALLSGCRENGVLIRRNAQIRDITKKDGRFRFRTDKETYSAAACILCCGGKAFPKSGSDGSGYRLAKVFGHSIVKPLPALMALYSDRSELFALAGVRAFGKVSLVVNGSHVITDEGELQFTDYGISGIPVFQISRYAAIALHKKEQVSVVIDLIPEMPKEELERYLSDGCKGQAMKTDDRLRVLLNGLLPQKITAFLLEQKTDTLSERIRQISGEIKHLSVPVVKTASFTQAQTTTGGVRVSEIDPDTMGSRLEDGLYFAGELIDIDGACGGYNLRWAWSSGTLAANSAAAYVRERN